MDTDYTNVTLGLMKFPVKTIDFRSPLETINMYNTVQMSMFQLQEKAIKADQNKSGSNTNVRVRYVVLVITNVVDS